MSIFLIIFLVTMSLSLCPCQWSNRAWSKALPFHKILVMTCLSITSCSSPSHHSIVGSCLLLCSQTPSSLRPLKLLLLRAEINPQRFKTVVKVFIIRYGPKPYGFRLLRVKTQILDGIRTRYRQIMSLLLYPLSYQ